MIEKLNPKKFSKVKFYYINQYEQNGLGHAVLQAESVIGNNSFAVLLPDDLFFSKRGSTSPILYLRICIVGLAKQKAARFYPSGLRQ